MHSQAIKFSIWPDGDFYEQYYWRYLCDKFPNYQEFWSKFIAPLTNRPNNIHPKAEVDTFLEKIWASHYSLFVQLGSAFRVRSALIDDTSLLFYFETIFYHLGVCVNQQEEFFFLLYCLEYKIKRKGYERPGSLTLEEFTENAKSYYKKYYNKDFQDFVENGRGVSCIFHSKTDLVSKFVKVSFNADGQKAYQSLGLIKEEIRAYRNFIEHSHQMGKILTKQGIFVPKYKFLKKYKEWSAIRKAGLSNNVLFH